VTRACSSRPVPTWVMPFLRWRVQRSRPTRVGSNNANRAMSFLRWRVQRWRRDRRRSDADRPKSAAKKGVENQLLGGGNATEYARPPG
jgi:hypothetical protein